MVQAPSWEDNWFAASQEIPRISRNPKVHYRTHKSTPPASILGQPSPIYEAHKCAVCDKSRMFSVKPGSFMVGL
jgi:hypothetical protein